MESSSKVGFPETCPKRREAPTDVLARRPQIWLRWRLGNVRRSLCIAFPASSGLGFAIVRVHGSRLSFGMTVRAKSSTRRHG
jgi:hypothetical protein